MNSAKEKESGTKKFELLFPQDQIAKKIKELGEQITRDYTDRNPILIGVLKGCIVFMADLIRHIAIPIELEFINASSYNHGQKPDEVVITEEELSIPLSGRHILLVEGVVDSGHTAYKIKKLLELQEPASIEIVTLLDKSDCRKIALDIKYRGFDAGDHFVIGFGLDKDQKYRNLPFIGRVLKEKGKTEI